ncbi:pentapeptide repeat-containing protein [Pyxidicoccus xibeiensis]|uniref:pentapeptide repeat-containing protein n=1 Tax=Pyxidicoccus xibeiensis TaxID=2906759 RepID=UPI0020A8376E|nr:pentapeptide repeat-containing protein [Pyxidicoccus xibeiensis]MCP3136793.1 pentapeptide repeat-containing protein [Pyxidicoccus xibeiensis]
MPQLNIENRDIENERLEIKAGDIGFLGPNLTLRNCTLVLRVAARNLILIGPRLIDCTIEVKRELKNFPWTHANLKGCRFTGTMTGCDFGRWPYDEKPERGGIEDCDFTGAHLTACRFVDCDPGSLKLPSWPCFTILDPMRRNKELLALPWPGTTRIMVESFLMSPPQTVAVTDSATALAKRFDTSEEAIRAVLDRLDGVIL